MLAGFRHRFRLNAKETTQLGSVPNRGRVKVAGRLSPGKQLLRAPITGRSCVFSAVWIEEWFNGSKTPLLEETSTEFFRIEDATGHALIDPKHAELYLRGGMESGHSSEFLAEHRALLKRHGYTMVDEYGELRSLAYRELILAPGEPIIALGTISIQADPKGRASYREQPTQIVISSDEEYHLLLSSPRP